MTHVNARTPSMQGEVLPVLSNTFLFPRRCLWKQRWRWRWCEIAACLRVTSKLHQGPGIPQDNKETVQNRSLTLTEPIQSCSPCEILLIVTEFDGGGGGGGWGFGDHPYNIVS